MKVIKSEDSVLELDNGLEIIGEGDEDCCAENYLDFEQLPVGTELPDMNLGVFIEEITVKEDGFSVNDKDGIPKWVQARSIQNGYYSNITTLKVKQGDKTVNLGQLSGDVNE